MPAPRVALGGMPLAAAAAAGARATARRPAPRTSRAALMRVLRRKGWQVDDLERHPLALGVPLGQGGGAAEGVSIDLGLKNMAMLSVNDLADASPTLKEALLTRAADAGAPTAGASSSGADASDAPPARVAFADLLRQPSTVPMAVVVPEDVMQQPVAHAVHPRALEKRLPEAVLQQLADPFFKAEAGTSNADLVDLFVEAVPDADKHLGSIAEHRREQRLAMQATARAAASR